MKVSCFHGGAFWNRLDSRFQGRYSESETINADVLDAWFAPSPLVASALVEFSDWSCNMSPPTFAEGLVSMISDRYECSKDEILIGAGSSALWFLVASVLLDRGSRVLLIEPSYGEYVHVCQNVVGCHVEKIVTNETNGWHLNLDEWVSKLNEFHYDLAVLVNPNNPTGQVFTSDEIRAALARVPNYTHVLIDEAYMDFYEPNESLLNLKSLPENVTVLSSFSKRFALSGMRVAMLRTSFQIHERLAKWCPPWSVSMPGQIAACAALRDHPYYANRYRETHSLRMAFKRSLDSLGIETRDSYANWLNLNVDDAKGVCQQASQQGLFIRNAGLTAPSLGNRWVRIAVKDQSTNDKMTEILRSVLSHHGQPIAIPV